MKCYRCHREFEPRDPRPNRPPKYCSRACAQPNRKARVTLRCRQCDCVFERKRYMQNWSRDRGPFCGFHCYGRWQKEHSLADQNPNFVVNSDARGASCWVRNRLAALQRDQFQCLRCGRRDHLHVHHKKPWTPDSDDPHALGNLETLCASCHRRKHPILRGPDGRFLSSQ